MATGKVKWFKDDTGYGFIEVDDEFLSELGDRSESQHPKDIFVHYRGIKIDPENPTARRTLVKNARVRFEIGESQHVNRQTGEEEVTLQAMEVEVIA